MSDKVESHIEFQFLEPGRLQWLGVFYGNEVSAWAAADYHRKKYPNDEVRVVRITTEVPDRPRNTFIAVPQENPNVISDSTRNLIPTKISTERSCDHTNCTFDLLAEQQVISHDIEAIKKRLEAIEDKLAHVDEKPSRELTQAERALLSIGMVPIRITEVECSERMTSENERRRMEEPDSM